MWEGNQNEVAAAAKNDCIYKVVNIAFSQSDMPEAMEVEINSEIDALSGG